MLSRKESPELPFRYREHRTNPIAFHPINLLHVMDPTITSGESSGSNVANRASGLTLASGTAVQFFPARKSEMI